MDREYKSIDITEFVANCSTILDDLDRGTTQGIDVTRSGKLIAKVRSAGTSTRAGSAYGSLRGSVEGPDGFDLTAPVFDDVINAEQGGLHE